MTLLEDDLKVLKEEYELLAEKIRVNNQKQNEIKRSLLLQKHYLNNGISIGDDVVFQKERAKLDSADANYLYVRKYKKDGSMYQQTTKVWSFDKIEKYNEKL
jgi:hypothetical protein